VTDGDLVASSPQSSLPDIDVELIRRILLAQWWTIVLFVVVGVGAVAVATHYSVRWYTAVAVLQLLPQAGQEIETNEVRKLDEGGYMEGRDRARTQIQIIQSKPVREEVVRRYRDGGQLDLAAGSKGAKALGELLSAGPREDTQLVEVRVEHPRPDAAALLANLTAQVYYEANLEFRRNAAKDTKGWIEGQAVEHEARLEAATHKLLGFKDEHGIVDLSGRLDETSARLVALQQAIGDANTKRVLLGGQLAEHERLLSKGRTDVLAGMFNDVGLRAIAQRQAEMQAEAAEIRARYGELHPEAKQAEANLKEVEVLVGTQVMRLIRAERTDYQALRRQEKRLEDELAGVKERLLEDQRLRKQYDELAREEDAAREIVRSLGQRGNEVDLQAQTQLSDVRIVDLATPPESPSRPQPALNLALAFIVSLVGGIALAVVRNQGHDSVLSVGDVERRVGVPVIATLPSLPAGLPELQKPLYPLDHPHSLTAEAYRSLRTMIQVRAPQDKPLAFLITSGVAGEGKTTTTVGLAAAFARLGMRVCVVDADLRRPRVHVSFGGERVRGVAEVLSRRVDPLTLVRKTPVEGLYYMAAGAVTDSGAELLYSSVFPEMMARMAKVFSVVLIDTSPVGLVSDALAVADKVDGVLLVIRRDHAPARLAVDAVQQLQGAEARLIGSVLNDVPPSRDARLYGRGYYSESTDKRTAKG